MANISPSSQAIDSIVQALAHAAEAACVLDCVASQDLRSLLQIAASEAERVRKAGRKSAAPKKPAVKVEKKSAKRPIQAKAAPQQQVKRRRKAAAVNGIAAH